MRGRRSAVTVASFALLAAAGCGGDDESERDEFVARGNEICAELGREFGELGAPPPQGTRAASEWELRVQQLAQRAFARLARLEPPEELRARHQALLDAVATNRRHVRRLRVVAEENARELRAGIADGPAQREYQDLAAELERDQQRVNAHMRALGWDACALLAQ